MAAVVVKLNTANAREPAKEGGVWKLYAPQEARCDPQSITFVDTELGVRVAPGFRVILETPTELIARGLSVVPYNDFNSNASRSFAVAIANIGSGKQKIKQHEVIAYFFVVEAYPAEIKVSPNLYEPMSPHSAVQLVYCKLVLDEERTISQFERLRPDVERFRLSSAYQEAPEPVFALSEFIAKRLNAAELRSLRE